MCGQHYVDAIQLHKTTSAYKFLYKKNKLKSNLPLLPKDNLVCVTIEEMVSEGKSWSAQPALVRDCVQSRPKLPVL